MEELDLVEAGITQDGDVSLPQKLPYELMLTQWAQQLNPLVANPIFQGLQLNAIVLDANKPKTISTTLNRTQLGWFLVDKLSSCNVWRTEPFNANTLTLESSADTTISIWVY